MGIQSMGEHMARLRRGAALGLAAQMARLRRSEMAGMFIGEDMARL